MKSTLLLLIGALAACPAAVSARRHFDSPQIIAFQKIINNTKIVTIDGGCRQGEEECREEERKDSLESLMNNFFYNQYRHFQDPKSPYLMFMSKSNNFAMGIGGTIRMRGWYDWNGSIESNGFSPYLISIPKVPTQMRRLAATPSGTALIFTVMGHSDKFGNYMGYIQTDFNGYKGVGFRLKKAYMVYNDWTLGFATSTFEDPATVPPTIDGTGPNGQSTRSNILVRYIHKFKGGWSAGGGVEMPKSQPDIEGDDVAKCDDYVPDIVGLGQYAWNGGESHVRLTGLLRVMGYRDNIAGRNYHPLGWAVQLSTVVHVGHPVYLFGQFNIGQGHASYTNDLSIDNYDLFAVYGEPGRLYAPTAWGLTLGAQWYIRPNVYSCLALAQERFAPRHNPGDATYKYGTYGALNVFWDITPRIQVGAEYLLGKRVNFDGSHGWADRVNILAQYSF